MAEWAAVPSCAYLQLQRSCFRPRNFMPQNVYIRIERRKYFGGKYRSVLSLSHDLCELSLPVSATREGRNLTKFSSRCRCLGSLVNPENATPLSWVSVVDQVLLMATVAFAYMAGVIPSKKVYFNARKNLPDQVAHTENSTSSGR
eukprot:TRINITY_DN5606_c0_g1_i3.p1 TRINITY_DN5606_c0_g1~~TRINITY_DN5606_c0_g1_i3.p1  ORF type:complete len:145 (-),score=22.00 TRINITY_DN5606_c0_g1_i3:52-486(-)